MDDFAPDIPLQRSLSKSRYVDELSFDEERELVLYADWFCVGREAALDQAGDYLVADVAGESVLVVRARDKALHAFYNVCRHRGTRLVPSGPGEPSEAAGRSGQFGGAIRCPYHAWTYALDGALRAAPFLPDARCYREQLPLHGVEVGTWGGFVFVRLEGPTEGESLSSSLGEVSGRLSRYPLEELRIGHRVLYQVAANWKVILENYNECYHCGPVHPELCELVPSFRRGGAGLDWDAGIPHREGASTFTFSGLTSRPCFPGLAEEEKTRHKGELVLPNLMLSLSSDHVAAFTLWPRSARHTTIVCDFLFHPSAMSEASFDPSDAVEFWDLVNRQDWWICEQQQAGMGSRAFSFGYLSPMEHPSSDVGRHVTCRLGST